MIQGISASDPIYGTTASEDKQALGKDAFMSLLVEQLKNQDPLAPTNNEAFVAQLAQFSSLEQMQEVNDNLISLALLEQGNAVISQLTESSALIGTRVAFEDAETGEQGAGIVESVRLEDGAAVLRVDGRDIPMNQVLEVSGHGMDQAPSQGGEGTDGDEPQA